MANNFQISEHCKKETNLRGGIDVINCRWSQYQRDRLCCYFNIAGKSWRYRYAYCNLHCGLHCRYCENPPSRLQTTTKGPPPACFPSTAKVNLQTGKTVTISELQAGDRVQTGMK